MCLPSTSFSVAFFRSQDGVVKIFVRLIRHTCWIASIAFVVSRIDSNTLLLRMYALTVRNISFRHETLTNTTYQTWDRP